METLKCALKVASFSFALPNVFQSVGRNPSVAAVDCVSGEVPVKRTFSNEYQKS